LGKTVKRHAVYFDAPQCITVKQETVLPPGPEQILVQSVVSAISSGTEMLIYRGQVSQDLVLDETISDLGGTFEFPFKYGYALVGQVIKIGDAVSPRWQDQLVFAFHPHESHFVTTPNNVLPLPDALSPEDAVFLPNMETAINLVMDGNPLIGEQVVVFGQGVIGLLTTALLARFPLEKLVAVDSFDNRRAAAQTLGANLSLAPFSQPDDYFQEHCDGADLIFEMSGNPAALDQAISVAGYDGRIVVGSWYGTKKTNLDLGSKFHRHRIRLISSQVSTIAPKLRGRWTKSRRIQLAWRLLQKIRPTHLITHRFHISQAAQAYQLLDQTPEQAIQVVLTS